MPSVASKGLHEAKAVCDVQVDLQKTWVMFSSIVLAFAFVFGNSVRTVYESIIYLFVVHPFDVGDKIIVDSTSSKVRPHSTAALFVFECCQIEPCLQQMPLLSAINVVAALPELLQLQAPSFS